MLQKYAELKEITLPELQGQLAYEFALPADVFNNALLYPELLPQPVASFLAQELEALDTETTTTATAVDATKNTAPLNESVLPKDESLTALAIKDALAAKQPKVFVKVNK